MLVVLVEHIEDQLDLGAHCQLVHRDVRGDLAHDHHLLFG